MKKKRVKPVRKKTSDKKVVKKTAVKKVSRKKVVKNQSPNKNSSETLSKKNFETFKFGVERLKELKNELESLDTRGFSKEESEISLRLKKVSEIPTIERKIKNLKLKIRGKYKPRRKGSILKKNIKAIKDDLPTIKRQLSALRSEIIDKKKKSPIDSGVEILVDTNFNDFLNETKSALSDRIKRREEEIDDTLKVDLEKRENNFHQKRENLIREFNAKKRNLEVAFEKKYSTKVKKSLQKEVSDKFNLELKKRLSLEKIRLGKRYITELKEHAREELIKQKDALNQNLQDILARRIKVLEKQFDKKREQIQSTKENIQKAKQNFILQKETERKRIREKLVSEAHAKLEREVAIREKRIRSQLQNEFELNLRKEIEEHEELMKKKRLDLEIIMQKRIKETLRG